MPVSASLLVGRFLSTGSLCLARANTGLVLQDYGLLPWATVWNNVALVMHMGRFYRNKRTEGVAPRPYPRPDITSAQIEHWLERLGIADLKDKYPNQISGGQRKRTHPRQPAPATQSAPDGSAVLFARCIEHREDLQRLTVELRQETGVTTLIVTHNIEEAVYLGQHLGSRPCTEY